MTFLSWCIVLIPLVSILGLAIYAKKYVRGVVDFLAAGRVAGRYVLCVGDLQAALGIVLFIGLVEERYQVGFALGFWGGITLPIMMIMALTGFCVYRFRETRCLSAGQFLEIRYSRKLRIFAASIRSITDMMYNAIGPAVAARFFIYLLGWPLSLDIFGFSIPMYAVVLFVIIALALLVIWSGGRVSLLITDCFQGLMSYPIFVIFAVYVLTEFSWGMEIAPVMMDRVPGESFLNPFDINQLRDFNLFAIFVGVFGSILNRAAWIGNDISTSGRTPHEQKMAGILGTWRNGFSFVMLTLLVVAIITFLTHQNFSAEAKESRIAMFSKVTEEVIPDTALRDRVMQTVEAIPEIVHQIGEDAPLSRKENLDTVYLNQVQQALNADGVNNNALFQEVRTIYFQTMAPMTLKRLFGPVLMGLFCLLMIMLMLSTDTTRIFNASSTILQDVIMPLRGKPFQPQQHLVWLRYSAVAVGALFFTFSLFVSQIDYINLFLIIVGAIWLGGSGPVMIFGLYSRFGTTSGAWASLGFGSGVSIMAIVLQRTWAGILYPFLESINAVEPMDRFLRAVSSPFSPYIKWQMDAVKFPINSFEIYFFTMLGSIAAYVIVSKLSKEGPFNLDRMLHRGEYAIEGEHQTKDAGPKSFKRFLNFFTGIGPEHTKFDRIISWSVFGYAFGYQFFLTFIVVIIWNVISPWPMEWWAHFFLMTNLVVAIGIGLISTVWFTVGGVIDLRRLFRDLRARVDDPLDDGWVEGNMSVVDIERAKMVETQKQQSD
jgi:Na+/proline symporter